MAEKKGIRVNALAKELGVESKAILTRLKDEGLPAPANHQSTISLGLAETVREWASSGLLASAAGSGGGTAVAEAPPKPARSHKKKVVSAASPTDAEAIPSPADEPSAPADSTDGATVEAPAAKPATTSAEAAPAAPAPVVPPAPAVDRVAPPAAVPTPPAAQAPPVVAPASPPPPAAPPVRPGPISPSPLRPAAVLPPGGFNRGVGQPVTPPPPPELRPTVTLDSIRQAQAPQRVAGGPVAPQLTALEPAKIQGPRVVREEKPDVVAAPRPRTGPRFGPGAGPANTGLVGTGGYAAARPRTGGGVKVDESEEAALAKKTAAKGAGSRSIRVRGVDGRRGEAMEKLKEFSEQDLKDRSDRLANATGTRAAFDRHLTKTQARGTHIQGKTAAQRGEPIEIEEPITVKTMSAATGIKTNDILKNLMKKGVFATINQSLDADTAAVVALEFGVELRIAQQQTLEEVLLQELEGRVVDPASLVRRPPVVTILGHVDHGKTSLLDKIRNANVAAGEAGGITQHTAAWSVAIEGSDGSKKQVTFIDTPGHQAFTAMRARGANMTDVVVLVVAAVEGVMPQTVESINHARAAEVPIVVALNKIDRPDANPDMVLGQLAAQGLNPVEWGGDIEVIRTSATTGTGIKELIEILDYQAELLDLKADPTAPARGSVIEARVDPGLGSVSTVLVQAGTLRVGDIALSGPGYGRIRSLFNDRGESIQEAGPSTPVIVSGLDQLPSAGDKLFQLDDVDRARQIAEERAMLARHNQLASYSKVNLDNLYATIKAGDIRTINLILKGDVSGSVETLAKTVTDVNTDEVRVKVIHAAVGAINESDVELADASSAVIIGFHVVADEAARQMAEQRHIEIRTYRVIYEIFDDLKKALSGLLEPEVREKHHGNIEVRQVFKVSKLGNIAGCFVTEGHVQRGSKIRLTRDGRLVIEDLTIDTLRRVKEDVKEVKAGFECGIKISGYDDIKIGDIMEAYIRETFQRTL